MNKEEFRETIWQKGHELFRHMPWRENTDPYYVLVSELMLQQTQVDRVIPKFNAFIERFPTAEQLSQASLADVLVLWSGLGYNRRAKYLHEAARMIVDDYKGIIPEDVKRMQLLPGIGPNTAAAILNYGYNHATPFIETNVRTVYFYHFFEDSDTVADSELLEVVRATLDTEHPREWFWALMDYGSYLKKQGVGQLSKSSHYKKQSALAGSVREVRGQIIKALTAGPLERKALEAQIIADERFIQALEGLKRDGLIMEDNIQIHLTK